MIRPRAVLLLALTLALIVALLTWLATKPQPLPSIPQTPQSGFRFVLGKSCDQETYPDQVLTFTRNTQFVRAQITTVMNCSDRATDPQVLFTPNKITLSIEESPSISGYAAACLCARTLIYDLYRPVMAGTKIVLQQAGHDVAHGYAP